MRPTPLMVREALFSILGHAVPASHSSTFSPAPASMAWKPSAATRAKPSLSSAMSDWRARLTVNSTCLNVAKAQVLRADVYRWADRWLTPPEPVNVFVSPPFADLTERADEFMQMVNTLMSKLPVLSVLTLQLEDGFRLESLADVARWTSVTTEETCWPSGAGGTLPTPP